MLGFRFNYQKGGKASDSRSRGWKTWGGGVLHRAAARSRGLLARPGSCAHRMVAWAAPGCQDWDGHAGCGPRRDYGGLCVFVRFLKRVPAASPRGQKPSGPPRLFLPDWPAPPFPLPRASLTAWARAGKLS